MRLKRLKKILSSNISKADLHIHSNHSDGHPSIEEILEYTAKETDLKIIAITDHDTITGAVEAQKIAKDKGCKFEVVVGEEVTSKDGHIVGLYLKEPIKPNMSAKETIRQIKDQGGIAIAAHPFYANHRLKSPNFVTMDGVGFKVLTKEHFDCVETANASTLESRNRMARLVNRSMLFKNETGGSDAHILHAIGKGYTFFYGNDSRDLRHSLRKLGYTQAIREHSSIKELFYYLLFFAPKGIELLRSFFTKDKKRVPELIAKKELEHFKMEKKELEDVRSKK